MGWLADRRSKAGAHQDSLPSAAAVASPPAGTATAPAPLAVPPEGLYRDGLIAKERGDLPEAERCFAQAGLDGNPRAANALAEMWDSQGDEAAAEPWYQLASDGGVLSATYNLGVNAATRGDLVAAEALYRQAATQGFVPAQNNLGVLLMERGDLVEARVWLQRALDSGDTVSGRALAHLDLTERGGDYGIAVGNSSD